MHFSYVDGTNDALERLDEMRESDNFEEVKATDDGQIQYGLTKMQRDTLVAAFNAGYFKVPRENSLADLSEQLDLSHQALSE